MVPRRNTTYPPSRQNPDAAHVNSRRQYDAMYDTSIRTPEGFWKEQSASVDWMTPLPSQRPSISLWQVNDQFAFADGALKTVRRQLYRPPL